MEKQIKDLELIKNSMQEFNALMNINYAGESDMVDSNALVIQELEHLDYLTISKQDILACEPKSIVHAVKSVIRDNLTLDPNANLTYVTTRSVNIKEGDKSRWAKVLEIKPTANGAISLARMNGRILDIKEPQVEKDVNGKVIKVTVEYLVPSYPSPRWEVKVYDEDEFNRWRIASHKERSRGYDSNKDKNAPDDKTMNYANALYTSFKGGIDSEFAKTKAVKHALKRLGTNKNEKHNRIKIEKKPMFIFDSDADIESSNEEYKSSSLPL